MNIILGTELQVAPIMLVHDFGSERGEIDVACNAMVFGGVIREDLEE